MVGFHRKQSNQKGNLDENHREQGNLDEGHPGPGFLGSKSSKIEAILLPDL